MRLRIPVIDVLRWACLAVVIFSISVGVLRAAETAEVVGAQPGSGPDNGGAGGDVATGPPHRGA